MDGATIGQYRITGLIGQGGMGAVYAAEHTLLGRPAAIKVLLPELSQKQDVVMRFFNEARAATAIRHPSIVDIYDFGWTPEGAAFIVMEHLDGESLGDRSSRARFRWPAALAIARQIAGALSAAHAKGIVHRDLKPDNVFLVRDPEVPGGERIKLLDFGIAKLAGETSSTINVTKTGAVMGTPTYMAPEQCRGIAVDHRADLYALGCVVFELCTGRAPFVGEGTGDVLAAHIHVPAPSLASLGAHAPPAVERLLQRLLAKAPGHRLQTADELIREIDGLSGERALTSSPGASGAAPALTSAAVTTLSGAASTSQQLPAVRASRRRRAITLIVAVATVASAAVVVVAMRRGDDEPKIVARPAAGRIAAAEPPPAPGASVAGQETPAAARPAPAAAESAPAAPTPAAPSASASPPTPGQTTPAMAPAAAAIAAAPPPSPPPAAPPAGRGGASRDAVRHAEPAPAHTAPVSSHAEATATLAEPAPAHPEPPQRTPGQPWSDTPHPAAPAPDSVGVTIDTTPPGAQVMLDGSMLGKTPFHGSLPRRDRDVALVLRLTGYADKTVVIHTDQAVTRRFSLTRPAAPRPRPERDQSVNPFGN